MGINMILTLVMGIIMTTIIGASVGPSVVENMKIKKVENRTLATQNLIKDSIIVYMKTTGKAPKTLEDLQNEGILESYHSNNLFGGTYEFTIDLNKGVLRIRTTLNDDKAGKYFRSSFNSPNIPICLEKEGEDGCKNGLFETFYLLPSELMANLKNNNNGLGSIEVGSIEYIKKEFTQEKLGVKEHYVKNPPKNGDKDFVFKPETNILDEYVYNEVTNKWENKGSINVEGYGNETKVKVANKEILYHEFNTDINKLEVKSYFAEKVICNEAPSTLDGKNVFVVNQNNKLGELIHIADRSQGMKNIYNVISSSTLKANDICTSNLENYNGFLDPFGMGPSNNFNQNLDRWDTENAISMNITFNDLNKFNNGCSYGDTSCPLKWDTRNVQNMERMFYNANEFNQRLLFYTTNVQNMSNMFFNDWDFNQPLNNWDVSNVKDMYYMFGYARSFNQNINSWDVSNVQNMSNMFYEDNSFNQPLNNWNVSNVTKMDGMFNNATNFNQPLNDWDVSSVQEMQYMFSKVTFFNQPLNNWNVSNVIYMFGMFYNATNFNQPLNNWDVSNVITMTDMFAYAFSFNQNINSWNVSNVQNMSNMFLYCWSFDQPLYNWNVSSVDDMHGMFKEAILFNQNINSWNTSKVTDMREMFRKATLFNQPLNDWNVSKVIKFGAYFSSSNWGYGMFEEATSFNQPLNNWIINTTSNVDMTGMFNFASSFNQNISNWNVSKVNKRSYFDYKATKWINSYKPKF